MGCHATAANIVGSCKATDAVREHGRGTLGMPDGLGKLHRGLGFPVVLMNPGLTYQDSGPFFLSSG